MYRYKNSYLRNFVEKCIKKNKQNTGTKAIVITEPKKNVVIALPYLGKFSLQICTKINHIMENKLTCCNLQIVLQTKCKISNLFTFKKQNSVILTFCHCL